MSFSNLFGFLTVQKEPIKTIPRTILYASLFLLIGLSVQSTMEYMYAAITKSLTPDPTSGTPNAAGQFLQVKEDVAFLLADYITFCPTLAIFGFLLTVTRSIEAAAYYVWKTKSFKNLFSMVGKTWIRALITALYISGLSFGYSLCVVALVMAPLVMYPNPIAISVAAVIGVPALILYLYLSVSWILAIVVSIAEEDCYGADALARSRRLVKGKKFKRFMLSLCFHFVATIISRSYTTMTTDNLLVSVSWILKVRLMVSYTVMYVECKKHYGEEMHGGVTWEYPAGILICSTLS